MIDPHCHILPGCDDGASNIEESKNMLKIAKECGIDKVIFTSHIKRDYASYDEQKKAYKEIKPIANKLNIDTAFGCEVHWKKLAQYDFKEITKFKLGKSHLFLLEFSYPGIPDTWNIIITKLKKCGFKVIIAHPERYKNVQENFKLVKQLKDCGCLIMLSCQSLNKERQNKLIWKTAVKMLKHQFVDFIASDAHNVADYTDFINALNVADKYNFNFAKSQRLLQRVF